MSQQLKREVSEESEDWTQWEVVDVRTQAKTVESPRVNTQRLVNSQGGSLININVNHNGMRSQLLSNKDEEKQSYLYGSKTVQSKDYTSLQQQYQLQQNLYQSQLDNFEKQQKQYLMNFGSKYKYPSDNGNKEKEKIEKLTKEQQRQKEELKKAYELCERLKAQKLGLEKEIKLQREQSNKIQEFTTKMLENQLQSQQRQHQIQLEQQRQLFLQQQQQKQQQQQQQSQPQQKVGILQNLQNNEFSILSMSDELTMKCDSCGAMNDESFKFCPKCGAPNTLLSGVEKSKDSMNVCGNIELLKLEGAIGNNDKYLPDEEKEVGWVLKNDTKHDLNLVGVRLERVGGSDKVVIKQENELQNYNIKSGEELYVLVKVKAPSLAGKYNTFWQLVLASTNSRICKVLELVVVVKKRFSTEKEGKIKKILNMGLGVDRKTIVYTLQKCKWDIANAANQLMDQI